MKSLSEVLHQKGYSTRFYKYFLSYMLLLVLVLLMLGAVVYGSFIRTLQQDVESSNISALRHIKNTMDIRIKEMEKIAVNISMDNDLKPYMVTNVGYDSFQAIRQLYKYKSGNEFVFDMALYHKYKGIEKIYTTETVDSLDTYFDFIYKYKNWNKDEFVKLTDNLSYPSIRPIETVKVDMAGTRELATYIYPLPVSAVKPYTFVMFQIEAQILKEMITNVLSNYNGYVYILDEKNSPIVYLTEGEIDIEPVSMLDLLKLTSLKENISDVEVNNVNYSVAKQTSDYNKWSYITVMRTDQFMKKVYTRRSMFYYAVFVILILGIIISFALSIKNYKPLRRLADLLSKQSNKRKEENYKDEYNFISDAFEEVSQEKNGLIKQLKSQEDMVKEQFLLNLLKRNLDDLEEIKNKAQFINITLDNPYFIVLIFLVDDLQIRSRVCSDNQEEQIKTILVNITESLAQDFGYGYGVRLIDGGEVALLLNLKTEFAKDRHISELAFKVKDYIKQNLGITMTVSVGGIYQNMEKIHRSYLEASRALDYSLIKGSDNVIFYEDIKANQGREHKYPVESETELILAIKQGKVSDVERAINDIRKFMIAHAATPEAVQFIYFGVLKSVIRVLDEMNIELTNKLKNEKEELYINLQGTIDSLTGRIGGFCKGVCTLIGSQKESKNFELRDRILNIINKSYKENTISLEIIADECGMSPSYISRFFKDHMGYPPMQYVDMLRMNAAKELLKNTTLPLKDILSQVGYIDESNFSRKFKKKEGITPMQYRSITNNELLNSDIKET